MNESTLAARGGIAYEFDFNSCREQAQVDRRAAHDSDGRELDLPLPQPGRSQEGSINGNSLSVSNSTRSCSR